MKSSHITFKSAPNILDTVDELKTGKLSDDEDQPQKEEEAEQIDDHDELG